jgi:hypothetical protein
VEKACQDALEAAGRIASDRERRQVEYLVAAARGSRLIALGQWKESAGYSQQAARIASEDGREPIAAFNLASATTAYTMAGDPEAGLGLAEEALDLARTTDTPVVVAFCLVALAGTLTDREAQKAHGLLQESLALRERLNIESAAEVTQATLIAARMGDWRLTLQLADRSIRHLQWGGQRPYLAAILNVVARALAPSDGEAAARLQGAARHLILQLTTTRPRVPADTSPGEPPGGFSFVTELRRQATALLHDSLHDAALRQLRAEGEAMDQDQAVAYALDAIARVLNEAQR